MRVLKIHEYESTLIVCSYLEETTFGAVQWLATHINSNEGTSTTRERWGISVKVRERRVAEVEAKF